jgi:hypothetical protein
MEYTRRTKSVRGPATTQIQPSVAAPLALPTWTAPELTLIQRLAANLNHFTMLPVQAQRQAVQPVLQATSLQRAEEQRLTDQRMTVQRQLAALPAANLAPLRAAVPLPSTPVTAGDWVSVMRQQAEQIDGQLLGSRERESFVSLQRQVAQTLVQGFRQDRQAPEARYASTASNWPPSNAIPIVPRCHG